MANSDGFLVNLEDGDQAADGVNGIIEAFNNRPVSAIPFESSAVGHAGLAGAVSGFLGGSQRELQQLVTDGVNFAEALSQAMTAYHSADKGVQNDTGVIFQGTGRDPGAAVMDGFG